MGVRLKTAIDSLWARSRPFRFLMIAAFLISITALAFLTWYVFRNYAFMGLILLSALVVIAHKKGYGRRR